MKLDGEYLFEGPVKEVWKALLDPVVLAAVMPGCEKLEQVDGGQFVGDLNIKVGPVQGRFSGKVDLKDIQEPSSYTMLVDARGAPGFVKATAHLKLEPEGTGTRVRYDADAQVGGKIASVGQRLLEASARAITKTSLDGLQENIKLRTEASKPAAPVVTAAAPETSSTPEGTIEAPVVTAPAAVPPPVVVKHVDQKTLAAAVAKEASKSLLTHPVVIVVGLGVIGLVVWLLTSVKPN